MRKFKAICCMALASVMLLSMNGCQAADKASGTEKKESTAASSAKKESTRTVNKKIDLPVFMYDMTNVYPVAQGSVMTIDGTAAVTDGGKVTYQWYVNNVDSNGGGTKIDGATDAVYIPDTSEVGTKFYYVVASNEKDNTYNSGTSVTVPVVVLQKGEWTTDEFGGIRYLSPDGTYPSNLQVMIDGNVYLFEGSGYRFSGWIYWDAYYFFDADGKKIMNGTNADGYHFDEYGRLTDPADPLGLFPVTETPAEVAAEAAVVEAAVEEAYTEAVIEEVYE